MAQKPYVIDQQQRELRQATYNAVPTMAKQFPKLEELVVELRFVDRLGKPYLSPYRRLYAPSMQAYFHFQCPMRDCTGGGFNLTTTVAGAVAASDSGAAGTQVCNGKRPQAGAEDDRCKLELRYEITMVAASRK